MITVTWNGDDGSGIDSYDLEVSEDGADWTRLLTATQATSYEYAGEYGHSYTFRVQATDNVSNTGDWAEATTAVVQVTKYYAFDGQRVAMREGDVVYPGLAWLPPGSPGQAISIVTTWAA